MAFNFADRCWFRFFFSSKVSTSCERSKIERRRKQHKKNRLTSIKTNFCSSIFSLCGIYYYAVSFRHSGKCVISFRYGIFYMITLCEPAKATVEARCSFGGLMNCLLNLSAATIVCNTNAVQCTCVMYACKLPPIASLCLYSIKS